MNTPRRELLKSGALSTFGLLFNRGGLALTKLKVSGEVLDKQDNPVSSVLVTLYRNQQKVDEVTTDQDGRYWLSFDKGEPIKTVRYERTGYVVGIVSDLCGGLDHMISKTLYIEKAQQDQFEGLSSLSALERVFYIDQANQISLSAIANKYAFTVRNLRYSLPPGPPSLQERYREVSRLFGIASSES